MNCVDRAGQRGRRDLGRWLLSCMVTVLLLMVTPMHVRADGIAIQDARLELSGEGAESGWHLNASFHMDLGQRLEDAVGKGLPLIFLTEVEIARPRWYWFNEKTVSITQTHRLSYNALTQQYRVSSGLLTQRFDSLPDAIAMISRVSRFRLASRQELKVGSQYEVAVRMRLDVSQLPKPFQINAMTNREWTLASDWKRFVFTPTEAQPQ
jgi:hypothetical protein